MVKIGRSRQLRTRLSAMRTDSPVPLDVAATLPGDDELEKAAHSFVREDRDRGEWFTVSALTIILVQAAMRFPPETIAAVINNHQLGRSERFRAIVDILGAGSDLTEDVVSHALTCKKCLRHIRKCKGVAPQVGTGRSAQAKGGRR
jgi:hypothetical protein